MRVAQKLYELGHISYHRTDSTTLPEVAEEKFRKFIEDSFGKSYLLSKPRSQKSTSKFAQEAHSAIYPTNIHETPNFNGIELKLYNLIKNRAIGSLMNPVKYEVTKCVITTKSLQDPFFMATFKKMTFPGFTKLVSESEQSDGNPDEENEVSIQPPELHSTLNFEEINATQMFSKTKSRYSEASLVQQLEERGIGRPSTYAGIIQIILERKYVLLKDQEITHSGTSVTMNSKGKITTNTFSKTFSERQKLVPSDIGIVVDSFLREYFSDIINYEFTSQMETSLDRIANGEVLWIDVAKTVYEKVNSLKEKVLSLKTKFRDQFERNLGVHPETNELIRVRLAKFGFVLEKVADENPLLISINLQQAKAMNLEEALNLLKSSNKNTSKSVLKEFNSNAKIMEGKPGLPPYFRYRNQICSIPKDKVDQISTLTLSECLEILKNFKSSPKKKTWWKKKTNATKKE